MDKLDYTKTDLQAMLQVNNRLAIRRARREMYSLILYKCMISGM